MRHALLALVVCAGCSQVFGLDPPVRRTGDGGVGDGPSRDGRLGDGGDGPSGFCYGSSIVQPCFASPPSGALSFNNNTAIDTDSSICASILNSNAWCVLAAGDVSFPHPVTISGSRPLVVVATGTITVNTTFDLASHRGNTALGAGADMPGCTTPVQPGTNTGGAGGSFGGTGGPGSNGANLAGAPLSITALRGGCPGQDGGGTAGSGGRGGGAVYLIAGAMIQIPGSIDASGEGGGGGQATDNGAGGGGSGGFIGLEAPMVDVGGQVYANGGGGGEGAENNNGNPGADPSSPTIAAAGGDNATANGGPGGIGSVGATKNGGAGQIGKQAAGGGGGGGGAGVVWLVGASSIMGGGMVSPPPN